MNGKKTNVKTNASSKKVQLKSTHSNDKSNGITNAFQFATDLAKKGIQPENINSKMELLGKLVESYKSRMEQASIIKDIEALCKKNEKEGYELARKLSAEGNTSVQFYLIQFILVGPLSNTDKQKQLGYDGKALLEEAQKYLLALGQAYPPHPHSKRMLAYAYLDGLYGISKDPEKGFKLLNDYCATVKKEFIEIFEIQEDFAKEWYNIALCHIEGIGTPKNRAKGMKILKTLIGQKYEIAYIALANSIIKEGSRSKLEEEDYNVYLSKMAYEAYKILKQGITDIDSKECKVCAIQLLFNTSNIKFSPEVLHEGRGILQKLSSIKNHETCLALGRICFISVDPEVRMKAYKFLKKAQPEKNPEASYYLSRCYKLGNRGVGADPNNARKFAECSAKMGYLLGKIEYSDYLPIDSKEGLELLVAAERELTDEMDDNGHISYQLYQCFKRRNDGIKALKYLNRASLKGNVKSIILFANQLFDQVTQQDRNVADAAEDIKKTIEILISLMNNPFEEYSCIERDLLKSDIAWTFANCYCNGKVLEKNESLTIHYLKEAAKYHRQEAFVFLLQYYVNHPKRLAEVVSLLKDSAKAGHAWAVIDYLVCQHLGVGVKHDPQAFRRLESHQNDLDGNVLNVIGMCKLLSLKTPGDAEKGLNYIHEAIKKGSRLAANNLAWTLIKTDPNLSMQIFDRLKISGDLRTDLNIATCHALDLISGANLDHALNLYQSIHDKLGMLAPKIGMLMSSVHSPISFEEHVSKYPKKTFGLGLLYLLGFGVVQDTKRAMELLENVVGEVCAILNDTSLSPKNLLLVRSAIETLFPLGLAKKIVHAIEDPLLDIKSRMNILQFLCDNLLHYENFKAPLDKDTFAMALRHLAMSFYHGTELSKDHKQCINFLKRAFDCGDWIASNNLAFCFYYGIGGVSRDMILTIHILERIQKCGSEIVKANLFWCKLFSMKITEMQSDEDITKISKQLQMILEGTVLGAHKAHQDELCILKTILEMDEFELSLHNPEVAYRLALCYRYGFMVGKDIEKAVHLWTSIVDNHILRQTPNPAALASAVRLGCSLKHGKGCIQNLTEAEKLFRWAANHNNAQAMVYLGHLHEESIISGADLKQAVELYESATLQENHDAINDLGRCYYDGIGIGVDKEKAVLLFSKVTQLSKGTHQVGIENYQEALLEETITELLYSGEVISLNQNASDPPSEHNKSIATKL